MTPNLEWGVALAALILALPLAAVLAGTRSAGAVRSNAVGLLVSVLLGPLLAAVGAWLDTRRGQAGGLLLLVLAALLTLDGMIATYFAGAPLFILVLASLVIAIWRRKSLQD